MDRPIYDRTEHTEDCSFNRSVEHPIYGVSKIQKTLEWYKTLTGKPKPNCPTCGVIVNAD